MTNLVTAKKAHWIDLVTNLVTAKKTRWNNFVANLVTVKKTRWNDFVTNLVTANSEFARRWTSTHYLSSVAMIVKLQVDFELPKQGCERIAGAIVVWHVHHRVVYAKHRRAAPGSFRE